MRVMVQIGQKWNSLLRFHSRSLVFKVIQLFKHLPKLKAFIPFFNINQVVIDPWVQVSMAFVAGIVVTLFTQFFFVIHMYKSSIIQPPVRLKHQVLSIPKVLKNLIGTETLKKKEEAHWLNLLIQFFFADLRDDLRLRKFLTKQIQKQLGAALKTKGGILIDDLYLRDFNLGPNAPLVSAISIDVSEVKNDIVTRLDIRCSIKYDGGFQATVDALLPFSRTAFVSINVKKLVGNLRLQFCSLPYSHWSFTFYEEPTLDVDIVAQLDGRPMQKMRAIFIGQIKKLLRRSFTLPNYSMRFEPFFEKQKQPRLRQRRITVDGKEVGKGLLKVTIIGANRLPVVIKESVLYITVTLDTVPYRQLIADRRKKLETVFIFVKKRKQNTNLGLTLEDQFLDDRLQPVVVVSSVEKEGSHIGFQKSDIILAVNGKQVLSAPQAAKIFFETKEKMKIQVERKHKLAQLVPKMSNPDPVKSSISDSYLQGPSCKFNIEDSSNEKKRTKDVEASQDPQWEETMAFFTMGAKALYLNICLWCSGGEPKDKAKHMHVEKSPNADILMGYTSIEMDNIYLTCLLSLSGCLTQRVFLKRGHYKISEEIAKEWGKFQNWDPSMMYGDLLLSFHFMTNELTTTQRQTLASSTGWNILNVDGSASKPDLGQDPSVLFIDNEQKAAGHHQFVQKLFTTATFCDYCGRKIWMKEAFECSSCHMVCHKKCIVKCLTHTHCTIFGVRSRYGLDEPWIPTKNKKFNLKKMDVRERFLSSGNDELVELPSLGPRKTIKIVTDKAREVFEPLGQMLLPKRGSITDDNVRLVHDQPSTSAKSAKLFGRKKTAGRFSFDGATPSASDKSCEDTPATSISKQSSSEKQNSKKAPVKFVDSILEIEALEDSENELD